MDPRRRLLALWFARGRALVGLALVLAPRLAIRLGIGHPTPTSTATVRMVGVRDLAIGLGSVAGIREGNHAPEWMGWGAAADGVDAVALLCTRGLPARARCTGLAAAVAAAVGMRLAWDLADERAAQEIPQRAAPDGTSGAKVPSAPPRE